MRMALQYHDDLAWPLKTRTEGNVLLPMFILNYARRNPWESLEIFAAKESAIPNDLMYRMSEAK